MILNMTPNANNGTESLVAQFSRVEAAAAPKWLAPVRKAGIASFAKQGFPQLSDEDWRFTNVAPIAKLNFQLAGRIRFCRAARSPARVRERIFFRETFPH